MDYLKIGVTWQLDFVFFGLLIWLIFLLLHVWVRKKGLKKGLGLWVWLTFFFSLGVSWFAVQMAGQHESQRVEKMLMLFAPFYAQELEVMGHEKITLQTSPTDPLYLSLIDAEKRWLASNPEVHDIYTLKKVNGHKVFLVDSETDYNKNGLYDQENETRTSIGESYDFNDRGLDLAFAGLPNFDKEPVTDRWGTWISANYPLYNSSGMVSAVLGIDYSAEEWFAAILNGRLAQMTFLAVVFVVLGASSVTISLLQLDIENRKHIERMKDEMIGTVSHELRAPLTLIKGALQNLKLGVMGEVLPQQSQAIESTNRHVDRLAHMVDDLLNLARLESGKARLNRESISLKSLIDGLVHDFKKELDERHLHMDTTFKPGLKDVYADESLVFRVICNLISNALRFAKKHISITVEPYRLDSVSSVQGMKVSIANDGPSIAPEDRSRLFNKYEQIERAKSQPGYRGTGLGLAISKEIIELHHGKIGVDNQAEGISFWFFLPCDAGEPHA